MQLRIVVAYVMVQNPIENEITRSKVDVTVTFYIVQISGFRTITLGLGQLHISVKVTK